MSAVDSGGLRSCRAETGRMKQCGSIEVGIETEPARSVVVQARESSVNRPLRARNA
jgi:hypothetical protein